MAEVSAPQAAKILSTSHATIFRRTKDGSLPAQRRGLKGMIRIDVDTLRKFAKDNGYRFNEELAVSYAK